MSVGTETSIGRGPLIEVVQPKITAVLNDVLSYARFKWLIAQTKGAFETILAIFQRTPVTDKIMNFGEAIGLIRDEMRQGPALSIIEPLRAKQDPIDDRRKSPDILPFFRSQSASAASF